MQIKKLLTLFIAALVLMAGVSCSDDDSPDVPDRPVAPVDHTLFMFFPWSNHCSPTSDALCKTWLP